MTKPGRGTTRVAALLLLLQIGGGGFAALADAREPPTAPITIEAQHDARCAVIHDAWRCALCHYTSARMLAGVSATVPAGGPLHVVAPRDPSIELPSRLNGRAGAPRGPPPPRA